MKIIPTWLLQQVQQRSLGQILKGNGLVFKGTSVHLAINNVIKKHGFTEKDFRFVNMDGPVGYSALASGDIDGLYTNQSIFPVVDRGIAKIIYSTKQEPNLYQSSGYILLIQSLNRSILKLYKE